MLEQEKRLELVWKMAKRLRPTQAVEKGVVLEKQNRADWRHVYAEHESSTTG